MSVFAPVLVATLCLSYGVACRTGSEPSVEPSPATASPDVDTQQLSQVDLRVLGMT